MAVTVKRITLWRREGENRPGMLAETLGPLAKAAVDLQVVMGYGYPGNAAKAAVELAPVSGKKAAAAAASAGLSPAASIPCLHVVGDNRPGLGHAMSRAIADAGININFLVAQVVGRKYSAVFGFDSEDDAKKAVGLIRKASRR